MNLEKASAKTVNKLFGILCLIPCINILVSGIVSFFYFVSIVFKFNISSFYIQLVIPQFLFPIITLTVFLIFKKVLKIKEVEYSDYNKNLSVKELLSVDGIGEKLAESFVEYFTDSENQDLLQQLSNILTIALPEKIESNASFEGKTFVITGSLTHFTNRNECKEKIESLGGKVSSSVSKNTAFLVNNDITSSSSKNKKAKELGVPIITEDELLEMIQ